MYFRYDVQTKPMETKTERGLVDIMFVHISTQLSAAFHSCLIIYSLVHRECKSIDSINKSQYGSLRQPVIQHCRGRPLIYE